jgi:hypothetical protein
LASINDFFSTLVYLTGGNRTVRLGSGKATACVQIEPMAGAYDIANVDLSSLRMIYGDVSISAIANKTAIGSDKNKDGIDEITACFRKEDLRTLFAGQPSGDYLVSIHGNLTTGGSFQGDVLLHIVSSGGALAATVSPNPLNPEATLTLRTSRIGMLRVDLYDLQGRLVRTLLREQASPAGYHDLRVAAYDARGNRLASGVYYLRIQSMDGDETKTIAVVK